MVGASQPVILAALLLAQVTLRFDPAGTVEARGVDAAVLQGLRGVEWMAPAFAIYLGDAAIPILGDYGVESSRIVFRPRFPFLPGREHRAKLDGAALARLAGVSGGGSAQLRFTPAARKSVQPVVTRVSPALAEVPANLLKFYIHFSEPMSRRGIGNHIQLQNEDGTIVEQAFLEMEDGLWDGSSRRLTVFFHPGRIKRGLNFHEESGPPLEAGKRYRLVVSAAAMSEEGDPMAAAFTHSFQVGGPDRTSPDPRAWTVVAPRAGTRGELKLVSPEPLDEALFARVVAVEDVEGTVEVAGGGREWIFRPESPWKAGSYEVRVGPQLEDLAGNRPGRLFDEPAREDGKRGEAEGVRLRVVVGR